MPTVKIDPPEIARRARSALAAAGDPVRARGAERYFKDTVRCYGVPAPEVRALAAELHRMVKGTWTVDDALELADILFRAPELEAKAVGGLILARYESDYRPSFLGRVKGWLAAGRLDNWASVDNFCATAMGDFLDRHPAYVDRIKAWTRHPSRWVRRAALVSFIKPARRGEFLPAIYEVSASLFGDDDDLIQKANGWLLREAGKADPARLERFLRRHGPSIPRTTLRYAIERFPERKRRTLLRQTRRSPASGPGQTARKES